MSESELCGLIGVHVSSEMRRVNKAVVDVKMRSLQLGLADADMSSCCRRLGKVMLLMSGCWCGFCR